MKSNNVSSLFTAMKRAILLQDMQGPWGTDALEVCEEEELGVEEQ